MAEEEVIIVEEEEKQEEKKKDKKLFFIIVILLIVVIILLLLLLLVVVKKKREKANKPNQELTKIEEKLKKKNIPKDEIQNLIRKANILYSKGQKKEALKILNKLSTLSEALSYYNLGVLKIREKNYKEALNLFQKAIENRENRVQSAINAAYSALMLKNYKLFDYYRNLAYLYLPEVSKNRNYPYYYSIVMYYMGYEQEALKGLQLPTSFNSNELEAAIYAYNNQNALAQEKEENPFYKGLLLAKIGDYPFAKNYLSMSSNPKAQFALALVDLKLSQYKEAAPILKKFESSNYYPIKIFLKDSLFNIHTAQKYFKTHFLKERSDFFDLFFYYAPYKVFNLDQTIAYLKKGSYGIVGNIEEAGSFLEKSAKYSKINIETIKALKFALNNHIYLANKEFKKLLKKRKNSYVINYDLGLTYAQLGDYKNAYRYFLRAYHLNPMDLKSGIYALMSAKKINKDNPHLTASLKEDLTEKMAVEQGIIAFITGDTVTMASSIEKKFKLNPTNLITKIAIKSFLGKDYSLESLKLKSMFERDIIANLLYFYSTNRNKPMKNFALNYQFFYMNTPMSLDEFYYGPIIVRDWYFQFAKISGLLNKVREQLEKKAKFEKNDVIPLLKRLAYANLYTKHFERAYVIYNDLINNKNITDPHTLYHSAVAAIGANHHSNAVALMELAKLKNPTYFEARYGLGLLWQEANNLRAASIQYGKIDDGFVSRYFDFNIKKPK